MSLKTPFHKIAEIGRITLFSHPGRLVGRLNIWMFMLLTVAGGIMAGCKSHEEKPEIPSLSEFLENMDTESEEVEEVVPKLNLSSRADIIKYLKESADSSRFNQGIYPLMAEKAPEYAASLLNSETEKFLIADKGKMRVTVYDRFGREIKSFRMAAGKGYGNKREKGDGCTPEGLFKVEGIYDSTEWLFTDDDGKTSDVKGQYGPRFIRIQTSPRRWPIGIHGTNAPWSIGGRRSHGCMRLTNDDIMELVELVEQGMPAIITPGRKDQIENLRAGKPMPSLWLPDNLKVPEEPAVTPIENDSVQPDTSVDTTGTEPDDHSREISEPTENQESEITPVSE